MPLHTAERSGCVHSLTMRVLSSRGVVAQAVRNAVMAWSAELNQKKEEWLAHNKYMHDTTGSSITRGRDEREALLKLKKELTLQVKKDTVQLTDRGKSEREQLLSSNREQAARVRAETDIAGVDGARRFLYEQRKQTVLETLREGKELDEKRKVNRQKKHEQSLASKDKAKTIETNAKKAKNQLMLNKKQAAQAARDSKKMSMWMYRQKQEEYAKMVKSLVNTSTVSRFAQSADSRRMLQHPHFQEVSAVVTDVTSAISKEIAANQGDRRNRIRSAPASSGGGGAPKALPGPKK